MLFSLLLSTILFIMISKCGERLFYLAMPISKKSLIAILQLYKALFVCLPTHLISFRTGCSIILSWSYLVLLVLQRNSLCLCALLVMVLVTRGYVTAFNT